MNTERRDAVRRAAHASIADHDSLPDIIANAIEAALSWRPEITSLIPELGSMVSRWGCGCDATECILRRDQMQDAGSDPHAVVSFTCISHGLVGRSHPGRVADGLSRMDAQAMLKLDQAHQEQCR